MVNPTFNILNTVQINNLATNFFEFIESIEPGRDTYTTNMEIMVEQWVRRQDPTYIQELRSRITFQDDGDEAYINHCLLFDYHFQFGEENCDTFRVSSRNRRELAIIKAVATRICRLPIFFRHSEPTVLDYDENIREDTHFYIIGSPSDIDTLVNTINEIGSTLTTSTNRIIQMGKWREFIQNDERFEGYVMP